MKSSYAMKRPDIEHEGIVTEITESHIGVRILQQSACAGCHAASLCSTAEQKEKIIEVERFDTPVQIGEKVIVALAAKSGYKALWLTAILPLILIVLSLAVTTMCRAGELVTGLCALLIPVIHYTILYRYRNRLKQQFTFFLKKTSVS